MEGPLEIWVVCVCLRRVLFSPKRTKKGSSTAWRSQAPARRTLLLLFWKRRPPAGHTSSVIASGGFFFLRKEPKKVALRGIGPCQENAFASFLEKKAARRAY